MVEKKQIRTRRAVHVGGEYIHICTSTCTRDVLPLHVEEAKPDLDYYNNEPLLWHKHKEVGLLSSPGTGTSVSCGKFPSEIIKPVFMLVNII